MAQANTTVWTFLQLEGEGKTLVLSDHCAPHGRPRRKPVVETQVKARQDTTRYSGNDVPTRHIFGSRHEPQKISGRLQDSYGGPGFAKAKKREIESFVDDKRLCSVTWDDIVGQLCFIESAKFGIESGADVSYEIEFEVDENLLADNSRQIDNNVRGPKDLTNSLLRQIDGIDTLTSVPGLRGSVFDSISSLIGAVGSATASLNRIAGQIDSFANAPFQLINQLRAALGQFRTAMTSLRRTYDDLETHILLENENANSWQELFDVKAAFAVSSLEAIRYALEMDRAAAVAQQGLLKAVYIAKDGDTWDEISRVNFNGSADRAEDIRKANAVEPGANPVPATAYMVPS